MIRNKHVLKTAGLLFSTFVLLFYTFSFPIVSLANTEEIVIDPIVGKITVDVDSAELLDEVPVYEENDVESDIIDYLEYDDTVVVLETFESMSLVEIPITEEENINSEEVNDIELEEISQELLVGYVMNEHIEIIDEDIDSETEETEEDIGVENDNENDSSEDLSDESDEIIETTDNEELTEDEKNDQSDVPVAEDKAEVEVDNTQPQMSPALSSTSRSVNLSGIALKNNTAVYSKQSKNSSVLKSYKSGTVLKYQSLNNNWYAATVYINGKATPGYIHASDVDNRVTSIKSYSGIGLQSPTKVFSTPSTSSNVLKSYGKNTILKYKSLSENWYQATVYINGKQTLGYIHKSHVENATENSTTSYGIALNSNTNIYTIPSTNSKVLKSYSKNTILEFKSFSKDWYQATVFINGKKTIGYLHKSHVENQVTNQQALQGIALQSPTNVYTQTSTNSKIHKSYSQGTILKYQTFSKDWYQATVFINGKKTTGYIHKNHVENIDDKSKIYYGIALNSNTNVYSNASTNSKVLKSYSKNTVLKFNTFSSNWYQATVYINGRKTTGYIHKNHVETQVKNQQTLQGIALQAPTNVYAQATTSSKVHKNYSQGTILRYETFSNNWYQATVYLNGKETLGYIHKNHVDNLVTKQENKNGFAKKSPTKIYNIPSTNSKTIKTYVQNSSLKFKTYSSEWYQATVNVSGKYETGYIHKNDVSFDKVDVPSEPESPKPVDKTEYTDYGITLDKALDIQMARPTIITDKYRSAPAYISADYVELSDKGKITGSVVNVRTEPNTSSKVGVQFKKGDSITITSEVNGESVSGSKVWYKIKHEKKTYYVHSSLASTSQAKVTANVNVRAGKGTNHHVFGLLTKGSTVSVIEKDSKWLQISYGTWRNPKRADMKEYLDPSKNDKFQHLRLDSSVGVSANELNKVLKGKGILDGHGQAFINGGKKHGVNEAYLISHAFLETGNGTSTLAKGTKYKGRTVYNMFGIGAVDSDPLNGGAKTAYENGWFTPEAAIEGGAAWISRQYVQNQYKQNTLYKMKWNPQMNNGAAWKQYATDIAWATKQVSQIKNIYNKVNNPSFHYDIARYK